MRIFNKEKKFGLKGIVKGHHLVTYKTVPAVKSPFDYVLYQMLIFRLRPDLIIEIGTHKGGTALYLADLLNETGKGLLHTIDLPENQEDPSLHQHPRISVFKNGFRDYPTDSLSQYPCILVIEDGSHQFADTLEAMEKFAPYVTPGSYLLVEDGIVTEMGIDKDFDGGPQKAIHRFLATHTEFSIDRACCDFFGPNVTFNVDGYLKKQSGS